MMLALSEVDRTFYVPASVRWPVWGLVGAFVLFHGLVAVGGYVAVRDVDALSSIPGVLRGLLIGAAATSFMRLKLATVQTSEGGEIPFGLELIYEELKGVVFGRINRIAGEERARLARAYAEERTLKQLATEVRQLITTDALMSIETKHELTAWAAEMLENPGHDDLDERFALADFVLSRARPSTPPSTGARALTVSAPREGELAGAERTETGAPAAPSTGDEQRPEAGR